MTDAPQSYLDVVLTPEQEATVKQMVQSAIPTTVYTKYIVVGDEPPDSILTVDLSTMMAATDFQNLSNNLRYMPRSKLADFLTTNIQPLVQPSYYDIIRKAIINLFNTVNVDEINKRGLSPWDWETKKTESLYLSQENPQVQAETLFQYLSPVPPTPDQTRENSILSQYINLTPIADQALEISRQAAVKGLLQLKEYDAAQSIIDSYKNTDLETAKVLATHDQLSALADIPSS